jgi:hypothetical protein
VHLKNGVSRAVAEIALSTIALTLATDGLSGMSVKVPCWIDYVYVLTNSIALGSFYRSTSSKENSHSATILIRTTTSNNEVPDINLIQDTIGEPMVS